MTRSAFALTNLTSAIWAVVLLLVIARPSAAQPQCVNLDWQVCIQFDVSTEAEFREAVTQIHKPRTEPPSHAYQINFHRNVRLASPLEIRKSFVLLNTNGFDVTGPLMTATLAEPVTKIGRGTLDIASRELRVSEGTARLLTPEVFISSFSSRDVTLQATRSMSIRRVHNGVTGPGGAEFDSNLDLRGPIDWGGYYVNGQKMPTACTGIPMRTVDTKEHTLTAAFPVFLACARLRKMGTGTLILHGLGFTSQDLGRGDLPAGGVEIAEGTLQLNDGAFDDAFDARGWTKNGMAPLTLNGGTLRAGTTLSLFLPRDFAERLVPIPVVLESNGGTFDTNGFSITLGSVSGRGRLTKSGQGKLMLNGANTYTGPTVIKAGTLSIGGPDALPHGTALAVDHGATVESGNNNLTLGSLSGAGTVSMGSGLLTIGTDGSSTTFDGSISGSGSVTKTGAGTLTLTGRQAYTGGTVVNAGALVGSATSLRGAIHNSALLHFVQPTDAVFDDAITGAGTVVKSGLGSLVFQQTQPYSGLTQIATGRLHLTAGVGGSVLVEQTATLSGGGTVAGIVEVDGTLSPTTMLTVGGDVALGPDASYVIPAGFLGTPLLEADGHVTIDGARLAIDSPNPLPARLQTYELFSAARGRSGNFGSVSAAVPLVATLTSVGSTTFVTLSRTDISLSSLATTDTGRETARALDASQGAATTDIQAVIRDIGMLSDQHAAEALTVLGAEAYATSTQVAMSDSHHVMRSVGTRLAETRTSGSPEQVVGATSGTGQTGFWVQSINQSSELASSDSARIDGGLMGFDRSFAGRWTAGVLGGYDRNVLDADSGSARVQDRRYRAGGYVSWAARRFYLATAAALASHAYETSRRVSFAAMLSPNLGASAVLARIDRTPTARSRAFEGSGMLEAGLRHGLAGTLIEPLAALEWAQFHRQAFRERGAESISLHLEETSDASAQAAIGIRLSRTFSAWRGRWIPRVELRHARELLDQHARFSAAFSATPTIAFRVTSGAVRSSANVVSAGLAAAVGRNLTVSGSYRAAFESWRHTHAMTFGVGF